MTFAELARAAVCDALGTAAVVENVQSLPAAEDAAVLVLRLRGAPQRLVLKLARPALQPGVDLGWTAAAMALATRAGVAVPEVFSADATGLLDGWQHLLQAQVDGRLWQQVAPLLTPAEQWTVHADLAAVVLALREVRPSGFGELDRTGAPTGTPVEAALRTRVRLRVRRPASRAAAEQLLERYAGLFGGATRPALCHVDLHHANLVVRLGRRAGGSPQSWTGTRPGPDRTPPTSPDWPSGTT